MRQLIVNADDFGLAPGINQGILEAHQRGIVTSTTVMVNFPDAPPGLERALAEAPDLGIGLHLNLTAGPPVSDPARVASLLRDGGAFPAIREWAAFYPSFEAEHLQREIAAQVDRFIQLAGRPPDHLDAHHHATYLHPVALRAMLEIAAGYRIPMRSSGLEDGRDIAQQRLQARLPELAARVGPGVVDTLLAVMADVPAPFMPARLETGFFAERATLGELLVILTTLPEDSLTELMCHPGYPDDALAPEGYREQRAHEVAHLTHRATLECVQAEAIEIVTFGDVPRR